MNITLEGLGSAVALVVSLAAYIKTTVQANAAEKAARSAQLQAETAAKEARFRALVDLLREFREPSFTITRHKIKKTLFDENPNNGNGFAAIREEELRLQVIAVVHYFDQLGLLVSEKLILAKDVSRFMGKAVEDMWKALLPYIQEERTREGGSPMYGRNFDELASVCNAEAQALGRSAA